MNEKQMMQETKSKYSDKYVIYEMSTYHREYDNSIEVLAQINDPTYDMSDFQGREMLFPKKWVTLQVYPGN